jgi:ribokinase
MSSHSNNHVMIVGSANQDLISITSVIPSTGETVMGEEFSISCGGKGANQAVAAACLKVSPVSMVCRVGDDIFGKNLLDSFRRVGVTFDEEKTVLEGVSSGVATVIVDKNSGDNRIIVSPGANYKLTKEDVQEAIKETKPACVVVQLEILPKVALEALKAGKEAGATTILNTAPAPEGWSLDDPGMNFYPYIDILVPNESELRKLCSEKDGDEENMAKALLKKGVGRAVVVTLGARGAMVVEKKDKDVKITYVNAPDELPARDQPIKDTVGAGDAFCGALSTYIASDLTLPQAATLACGIASMSIRKVGAQTSYPSKEELPECLTIDKVRQLIDA